MDNFLDSLDRLIQLEEAQPQFCGSIKKRQRVIEAGRILLLENDRNSTFLSLEAVHRYEELTALYIASLNEFSCEEVYRQANHILAFHQFQSKNYLVDCAFVHDNVPPA